MTKRINTKTISLTIDNDIYENISKLANNKSKLTEWLIIDYLNQKYIDTKKIKF